MNRDSTRAQASRGRHVLLNGFGSPWEIAETRRRHAADARLTFDYPILEASEMAVDAARRAFGIDAASIGMARTAS